MLLRRALEREAAADEDERWSAWPAWSTATPGPPSTAWRWPSPWPKPAAPRGRHRGRHRGGPQHPRPAYGEDEHYDVISAFIKSIRGSDADAGLYWLARMLEAGEDARFIARRLVILASEDVGMADPQSLLVADAAARAVEFVGLARGPAQPGPRCGPPGQCTQVQLGHGRSRGGQSRMSQSLATRLGAQAPPRRPSTRAPPGSGTAKGTCTPTTSPVAGWRSSTGRRTSKGGAIGSRRAGDRTSAGRPGRGRRPSGQRNPVGAARPYLVRGFPRHVRFGCC